MTISTTISRVTHNGNGVTDTFGVTFPFLANEYLIVILIDALGVETTLTLNTDYTVTGAGSPGGGSIVLTTPPAVGETLLVYRQTDLTQETDYISGDEFPSESHERALDKLTMIAQETSSQVGRVLFAPQTDPLDINLQLPTAQQRANTVMVFDENGEPVVGPALDDVNTVSQNITNIGIVADDITNVNIVATNIGNVNTVAADITNVNTVAANTTSVNTVAADIADVVVVSENIANINAAVADLPNLAAKVSKTSDTGAAVIPSGPEIDRPGTATPGMFRHNEDVGDFEGYRGGAWKRFSDSANIDYDNTVSALTAENVQAAIDELAAEKLDADKNIVLGTSVVASGTAVDFTNIPTGVKRVTVMFDGISLSGTSSILVQVGAGSVATSGYIAGSAGTNNSGIPSVSGFPVIVAGATNTAVGALRLESISPTTWISSHSTFIGSTTVGTTGGGAVTLSSELTTLRVTTVNGTDTFDAGTINISWE